MVIVELAATLCIGVLLQSSQCQGSPAQSSQGSVSPSVSGGGESGLSGFLSLSLSLRLDRSDISFFCASCARVRSPLRRDFDSHRLSASPPSYHSAYQNRNLFTIVFLSKLHTYLQHHHCCTCYPSSKWPLWIVHTAIPSDSAIRHSLIVTKLNFLVSLTFLSLLVFGCVLRVLKTIQFY